MEENPLGIERLSLAFGADGSTLTLRDARGHHTIGCGAGALAESITGFVDRGPPQPIAAAGAWPSPSVSFGPTSFAPIVGRRV